MVFRLVLGYGSLGERIVGRLAERDERLAVVTDDADVVETLREDGVRATYADPTDPAAISTLATPGVVFIATDRADVNRRILERARERFPAASIVAFLGEDASDADREAFTSLADRVVDPRLATASELLDRTASVGATTAIELREQLRQLDGRLAVVTHDNPDPDAIASAVALVTLANALDVPADACYFGEISHQENRAMVNLLDLELRNLDQDALAEYTAFALVDHSRPGANDQLPAATDIDIVIDHHPPRGPVSGAFVDLREDAGSTSTIMTAYLDRSGVSFETGTATALLYGIRVDTDDFTREASAMDFQAASLLWPHVETALLDRIEQPTVEGETLDTVARAIQNRDQRGTVVAASAGRISDRDALPQAAEKLLSMAGVETALVFGIEGEMVYLSARSRADDVDLGETLRDAFEQIGSAGGHANMAGAQLEVGILATVDDDEEVESIVDVVEEVIRDRFFEAIRSQSGRGVGTYDRTSEWLFVSDRTRLDTGGT